MIPQLSDKGIDRVGSLLVHTSELIDEMFFGGGYPTERMGRLIKLLREDIGDHEMMALKLALDRENRLPKEVR